jgi:hypothetical protein
MKISPPAYPTYLADNMAHGMQLRDYFAAAALPAIMKHYYEYREESMVVRNVDGTDVSFSCAAYEMADAMMKAREE